MIQAIWHYFRTARSLPLRIFSISPKFGSAARLSRERDEFGERGEKNMVSPLQQKIRVSGPVVITANRLFDGAVVHRSASGAWTEELGSAQILWSAAEAQNALRAAQSEGLEAVGAYVAPIDASEDTAQPGNLRELIRKSGPTFDSPSDRAAA